MRAVDRQPRSPREGLVETADHCETFKNTTTFKSRMYTCSTLAGTRVARLPWMMCNSLISHYLKHECFPKIILQRIANTPPATTHHTSTHCTMHLARVYKHESNFLEKIGHVDQRLARQNFFHRIFLDMVGISFESCVLQLCFGQFSSKSMHRIKRYDQFCKIFH